MEKNFKKVTTALLLAVMALTMLSGITVLADDVPDTFTARIKTHDEIFDGSKDQYKGFK